MVKFVSDFLFGLAFGLGLLVAYGVLHVVQIIVSKA